MKEEAASKEVKDNMKGQNIRTTSVRYALKGNESDLHSSIMNQLIQNSD